MFEQTRNRTLKLGTAGIAAFAVATGIAGPAQATSLVPQVPAVQLPGAPALCTVSVPVRFDRANRIRQSSRSVAVCAGQLGQRVIRPTSAQANLLGGRVRVSRYTCALQLVSGRLAIGVGLLPYVDAPDREIARIEWRALQPAAASPIAGIAQVGRSVLGLDGTVAFRSAKPTEAGCAARKLQPGTLVFDVALSSLSRKMSNT